MRLLFRAAVLASVLGWTSGCNARSELEPTVILVSLDGFRADYIDRFEPPVLSKLTQEGVWAESGMVSVFPTLTFPNHYSIATGLYPAHHGIVSNTMYDPEWDSWFRIGDRDAVEDGAWWGGEPLWVTAEKQGQVAATFYWVGSEAPVQGVRPTFWKRYDVSVSNEDRVDQVLEWLELPAGERPTLIQMYFSTTDGVGHRFGPDSDEIRDAVAQTDTQIGRLVDGLAARGMSDQVNLIIVSDHGMTPVSPERVVALGDYVDRDDMRLVNLSPVLMLEPKPGREAKIRAALENMPHVTLLDDAELESRFHFTGHRRIPSVVAIVDDQWVIMPDQDAIVANPERPRGGAHGYNPELISMRALFVATGPAFRKDTRVEPFENIHIYNLVAHILGLRPAANDGDFEMTRPFLANSK